MSLLKKIFCYTVGWLLLAFSLTAQQPQNNVSPKSTDIQPESQKSKQDEANTTSSEKQASQDKASSQDKNSEAQEKTEKPSDPKLLERIGQVLKYGNSQQVRDVLSRFEKLTVGEQKSFLPDLEKLCSSKDALIRRKMAEMIGKFTFNDLDEKLTELFTTADEMVFYTVVASITKKKPASALPVLREKMKEADFKVLNNKTPDLIRLGGVYKDVELRTFLLEKYRDASTYYEYRGAILRFLAALEPVAAEDIALLESTATNETESITLRSMAVYALGEMKHKPAAAKLREILDKIDNLQDPDEKKKFLKLRIQIISALVKLDDPQIEDLLFQMARDDDEAIRVRAIRNLAGIQSERARELLEFKSKYDPSVKVQKEAKKILDGQAVEDDETLP